MKCSIKRCAKDGTPIGEGLYFCAEHHRAIWSARAGAHGAPTPTIGRVVEEFMADGIPRPETMGSIVDQAVGVFRAQWSARLSAKPPKAAKPPPAARLSRRDLALKALGFPPGANPSREEITKAYRRLARQHHPDKGGDQNNMQILNRAYDVLLQPVPA